MKKKKVLLIGSEGFIGGAVKEALQNDNDYEVVPFDITLGDDMLDEVSVAKSITAELHEVILLAAEADLNKARIDPYNCMKLNVKGVLNVANRCWLLGVPLHFISTCCVYGDQERHPSTEDTTKPNPSEIYTHTKLAGEHIIKGYGFVGLNFKISRIPTTYGKGMRSALGVAVFFEQALAGEDITIHGEGEQERELTYIDDTASGIIAVLKKGHYGETYNITVGCSVSALTMAKTILNVTGSKSKMVFVPQREGQFFTEIISHDKITRHTNWMPRIAFNEGIEKTYEWYKEKMK